ncbi:MAG: leucine-rich repeat domain-containing protein, partial [Treponema sp.]|nr:leucine-rich repeat domain-containing protein [Treponema sp.]
KTKVTGDLSAYSDVFQGAGIKEVIIPNTITKLGNNYFSGCTQLTEVTFESGSQLPEIPNSLFSGCTSLNSITNLPSTITRIGTNAFNNTAFTSFVVPNGVTEIGGSAFGSPKNLSYLVIPTSVTTIGSYLFFDSNHMIDVKYRGNETQWNNNITKADGWNKDRPSMGTNVVNSPITYNYTGD